MIGLVLSLFIPFPAFALRHATIEEQAEIQWHIDRANHATNETADQNGIHYNRLYGAAFDRRIRLETKMGIRDEKGHLIPGKSQAPTREDLKKISGGWFGKDEREEYAKALRICQQAEKAAEDELTKALELAQQYYRTIPIDEFYSGRAINGSPLARGRALEWSPRVSPIDSPPDGFLRLRDGQVFIRRGAFSSPGNLAATVFHEGLHQIDLLTPETELDLRNEPWQEVKHLWNALAVQEKFFELTENEWTKDLKAMVVKYELAGKWQGAIDAGKDPYNEEDRKSIFSRLRLDDDRLREIDRQVDHDLQVLQVALSRSGPGPESVEYVKANAQSDFFKRVSADSVLGLAQGWKEARALEASRRDKEIRILVAKAGLEARQCGFKPILQDGRFIRFRLHEGGWFIEYDFTSDRDLDEVKAGFLLARACVSITRDKTVDPPCNDALDAAGRRGTDLEFWNDTDLKTGETQESCMQHLRENLKPPFDARAFEAASKTALAAQLRRTKQEEEADARKREIERRSREIEERERRRRDREESGDDDKDRGHGDPFLPPWVRDPWNGGR